MAQSPQFLLPLEGRPEYRLEEFVPGPNKAVLHAISSLAAGDAQSIFVSGPAESGKTHLLAAAITSARENRLNAMYLAASVLLESSPSALEGLEQNHLVCIDDVDRLVGVGAWEEALFYLFNRLRQEGAGVVFSSSQNYSALQFALPDLASRLAWGLRLKLLPLDDEAKLIVLDNRVKSYGLELPAEVGRYLIRRRSRDMAVLLPAIDLLCTEAMRSKRRLTLPLVKEALVTDFA